MKLEREIIIDLLPAYFSGEASAATCALVEDYFRDHPDFAKTARDGNFPLEGLKVPVAALDEAKAKLAFERARQITEVRGSTLWLAVCFTLLLGLFRIADHKIVWIMWNPVPLVGAIFGTLAFFYWMFYLHTRRLKEPIRIETRYLWSAALYTALVFLFKIKGHKVVLLLFSPDPTVGIIFGLTAVALWISYFYHFYQRRRTKRAER